MKKQYKAPIAVLLKVSSTPILAASEKKEDTTTAPSGDGFEGGAKPQQHLKDVWEDEEE